MDGKDFRMSLHGLPYDQTVAAEPPIKITTTSASKKKASDGNQVPPLPPLPPHVQNGSTSPTATQFSPRNANGRSPIDMRKTTGLRQSDAGFSFDSEYSSGITATRSPVRDIHDDVYTVRSPSSPTVPQIFVEDDMLPMMEEPGQTKTNSSAKGGATDEKKADNQPLPSLSGFSALTLDLPSKGLGDELQAQKMAFSNRGSMFLDGRKVSGATTGSNGTGTGGGAASLQVNNSTRPNVQRIPTSSSVPDRIPPRMMSTDDEMLSEKVRQYYAVGSDATTTDADGQSSIANRMNQRWQETTSYERNSMLTSSRRTSMTDTAAPLSPSLKATDTAAIVREDNELAGGLEDWQDIDNADVDRYGFIVPQSPTLADSEPLKFKRSPTSNRVGLQRVSTSLQLASEAPRRRHTIRRAPSSAHGENPTARRASNMSSKSAGTTGNDRPSSARSAASLGRHSALRAASNRLPGYRDRRLMDEAADMLTLPRSLTSSSQTLTRTPSAGSDGASSQAVASKMTSAAARKKEIEREEKWRKMAKPISSSGVSPNTTATTTTDGYPSTPTSTPTTGTRDFTTIGTTLLFSFPPSTDQKLVSRTWKGIPDSWRAQAWHYFLSVSAAKHPTSIPDDKLIKLFYTYQERNSPDDVQIDIDVPRTISSHIMFRRRYRGGQRLLFRVLHAMSLHWSETGYVQGMAALAATLLAYYEEEKAFVMLVRLWDVRGLGRLYESGFGGLMEALDQFERGWLGEGEVGKKLNGLNIVPTAYGTKWYLTLFNYSIPFPAQLRVWDVFMLLGDDPECLSQPIAADSTSQHPPLGSTLDVLHATSAALIDGMRDILMDSDFENAMKVLTSWIPIRDEDLFMRVAKAEWKLHRKR